MEEHATDLPPTSKAATAETEPEIVAGISSAEGSPDLPTDIRIAGGWRFAPLGLGLLLLGAGAAAGYALVRWLRPRA